MQAPEMPLSGHARRRMAQRNLSSDDVKFVRQNGIKTYRAGVLVHFLGRRSFQKAAGDRRYDRLEGTTILSCPYCLCVLTAYRNRARGLKDHCRKTKYDRIKHACPVCGR